MRRLIGVLLALLVPNRARQNAHQVRGAPYLATPPTLTRIAS